MIHFVRLALHKASRALGQGRLPVSPLAWIRLLRQLSKELRDRDRAAAAQMAALRSFLSGTERLTFDAVSPAISVVLSASGSADCTLRCLRSLSTHSVPIDLLVVMRDADAATAQLVDRIGGGTIVRDTALRVGRPALVEVARLAKGDVLLFLDSTLDIPPASLEATRGTLLESESVGAVVGRRIGFDGWLLEAGSILWTNADTDYYGRGDSPTAPPYMCRRTVDFGSTAFLAIRRRTFCQLGGFDTGYQTARYADADLCTRLWQSGLQVVYEPQAAVTSTEPADRRTLDEPRAEAHDRALLSRLHGRYLAEHAAPRGVSLTRARSHGGASRPRVLLIDDCVPHEKLGSGYPRTMAIIRALMSLGYDLTMYPLLVPVESWEDAYADIPREIELWLGGGVDGLGPLLSSRLDDYWAIICSRPHNMRSLRPALQRLPRRAPLIYDAEAIYAEREARRRLLIGDPDEIRAHHEIAEEIALAEDADLVLAVSTAERESFVDRGVTKVRILGHALTPGPSHRPFEERRSILFVGACVDDAAPNTDSVRWFAKAVFPRIRQHLADNARWVLAGLNTDRVLDPAGLVNCTTLGLVDDLTPLFDDARVFVAPTRYAAGVPLKVYGAAAYGVPIVASSLVASQLEWRNGVDLLVADDAPRFAESCVRLFHDRELWHQLRANALARVTRECNIEHFTTTVSQILDEARAAAARRSGIL